jgi:hypothetical protein
MSANFASVRDVKTRNGIFNIYICIFSVSIYLHGSIQPHRIRQHVLLKTSKVECAHIPVNIYNQIETMEILKRQKTQKRLNYICPTIDMYDFVTHIYKYITLIYPAGA